MMFITDDIAYVDRDVWNCEFHLITCYNSHVVFTLYIDGQIDENEVETTGQNWFLKNWQGDPLLSVGLGAFHFEEYDEEEPEDLFWDVSIAILFKDRTWDTDNYIVLAQTESAAKAIALAEAISFSQTLPNPEFCEWFFITSAKLNEDLDDDEKAWIKGDLDDDMKIWSKGK